VSSHTKTFRSMSRAARLYLASTTLAALGAGAAAVATADLGEQRWAAFALLAIASAVAQLFVVRTQRNQAYHTTIAFIVPAAILLSPALIVALVLVQHTPEYVRERYRWYIATFNVTNYALNALAAWAAFHLVAAGSDGRWAAGAFAAAFALVACNHGLLAVMLKLGRGHSLRRSTLFTADALATDLAPAVLGVVIAHFALQDGWLVPAAVLPLCFLYRALAVPRLHADNATQSARAERERRLTALGLSAMSGASPDAVVDEAMCIARDHLGLRASRLVELDAGGGARLRACAGCRPEPVGTASQLRGVAAAALARTEPVVAPDGARIAVAVPGRDGPIGVMSFDAREPREHGEDELQAVQVLATTVSVVLHRERTDLALRQSEERRQIVLDQMLRAEQEERLRIATDLHDDTIQVMTATLIGLDRMGRNLQANDVAAASTALGRARQTLSAAVDRTRLLTFELRPPLLEANGLAAAVEELVEQVGREARFDARVAVDVGRYPLTVEDLTYRIVQEAIANVRKHAGADQVEVELRERDGELRGSIADDGCGFDIDAALDRSAMRLHLGLDALIERVRLAGGTFDLRSHPGAGSRLSFTLPLDALSLPGRARPSNVMAAAA
jgi:signal transduction histidine kinase